MKQEQTILQRYAETVRICFTIVSGMGRMEKDLYFKNGTPSKILKKGKLLLIWVQGVLKVINQPKNNHLDRYKEQLEELKSDLEELFETQYHATVSRKNLIRSRKALEEEIKENYKVLKFYVKGWLTSKKVEYKPLFAELKLTATPKPRVKVELLPQSI